MILQAISVAKQFQLGEQTIEVLRDINFHLEAGETVSIIGPSGSGKSTLLSLIAGLDHPDKGNISLVGRDLSGMSEADLAIFRAQHMSIVFQQFHLLSHLTALENVQLPLEIAGQKDASARAREALTSVGLQARDRHFPFQLSGGEQQRVAIARALVSQPDIILADEPSGNLDSETGHQVMNLLFDLVRTRNTSLILVTHNPELAARCDRCLRLSHGELIAA